MRNVIVELKNLSVHFDMKRGFLEDMLSKEKKVLKAVDGVSFEIRQGEVLSLVGESGSGKTTTGKAILDLVPATGGEILFQGRPMMTADRKYMKNFRQKAQMIYQDPYQSMNPRDILMDIIAEPLDVNGLAGTPEERMEKVVAALEHAGLTPAGEYLHRYPFEISGGQRQRVAIASAMIMEPDFIVADEPVSMLDASIRTGILKLMLELQKKKELAYLFITHDLSLAWLISDRIAIMYLGRIMEIGRADDVIKRGLHPYTKALTDIMPIPGVNAGKERVILPGETPDPTEVLTGCKFRSRCSMATSVCSEICPELKKAGPDHLVACHHINQEAE